jgi:hypothetical protein
MRKWPMIVAGALVLALSAGLHVAQAASTTKQRSAASIECSQQADAKGLHGKARRHFRDKCKMGLKSAGATSKTSYKSEARTRKHRSEKQKSETTGQKAR